MPFPRPLFVFWVCSNSWDEIMRVLQLLPELNQGGVERGTVDMVEALKTAGHEAYVASAGGAMLDQIEALGGIHYNLPIHKKHIKTFFIIPKLVKLVNDIGPDIIHVRSRVPAWLNHFAKSNYTCKPVIISTFHGLYSVSSYSKIMTKVDRIIAISNTVKSHIINHYRIHPAKISLIPRGCDANHFRPGVVSPMWQKQWYTTFPQTKGKKILSIVSRLSEKKGIDHFIRLLSKLDDSCHGLIVGSLEHCKPKYLTSLKALVEDLNISDRITFCGLRRDVKEIYSLSDLTYALKIEPEAFGRTVVEAIQMKTPVIGWDIGGVAENLKTLFPEGLIPLKDEQALLVKTQALLAAKDHEIKENIFTKDKMVNETIAVYEAAIRQNNMECERA